jgi:acetate kinase
VQHILTLNAGSSSIKFAMFEVAPGLVECVRGQVEGIGAAPRLNAAKPGDARIGMVLGKAQACDHTSALAVVLEFLENSIGRIEIEAVGHRIVHGGADFSESVVLDAQTLACLERLNRLAPLHQPHNLSGVRAAQDAFPDALQVANFDTAFHRSHSWVNDVYALPRDFYAQGIRRYGFHGLSYEYVIDKLQQVAPLQASGRVVIAHLGNGASICAIRDGKSAGSSMGFTALDGLPMGTRCGQLDPGVVLYLIEEKGMSARAVADMLYRQSGLKGLSGISHDMRQLEAAGKPEAMQAIEYFVARIRRELGAMAAILSGLDTLVLCGGIGENSWRVREQICQGFEWLGIELDNVRNRANEMLVSSERSRVPVFVIPTNEELMIARHTARLLASARSASLPPAFNEGVFEHGTVLQS